MRARIDKSLPARFGLARFGLARFGVARFGWALALVLAGQGCARSQVPTVRFVEQDVVWDVDDTQDVPVAPQEKVFDHLLYVFENVGHRPIDDALAVRERRRAANVNALGEVPDSTWFTNRIGMHDLAPEDVARGPNGRGPDDARPWTVVKVKAGGASPGLIVEDTHGVRYILKFDRVGHPEVETAADVVTQRLLWAAGYNVPENFIVYFRREDLVAAEPRPDVDPASAKPSPSEDSIDAMLAEIDGPYDGVYRGMASKYLSGTPLGGYEQLGTRPDDPNDLVPHENRRDIRGQYVLLGWVAHTDIKEDNTLDMWVEDPSDPGRHYVMHYLVDFGSALGARAALFNEPHDSYAHNFDYAYAFGSALALGAWRRPWEYVIDPGIKGVGRFDSDHFRPQRFHSRNRYVPLQRMDRFDAYWAAKILMRFTPEHIRAAVEQGQFSDPDAVEYLTRTLIQRQRFSVRRWLGQINPVDEFKVAEKDDRLWLCATDLWRLGGFDEGQPTAYETIVYDRRARRRGKPARWRANPSSSFCLPVLSRPPRRVYLMIRLTTERDGNPLPPVWIHAAPDSEHGEWRVIGLWRE